MGSYSTSYAAVALRIAVALIAAVCAVLIPGEAERLMTTPLLAGRRARTGAASPAVPATAHA